MDSVQCKARKWGNSIGIIIPHDVIEREGIRPDDTLRISVNKNPLAKDLWTLLGSVTPSRPISEIRKELKKGW